MKHKHCDLIVAWANGAVIEYQLPNKEWRLSIGTSWNVETDYRIKLQPKPDVVRFLPVKTNFFYATENHARDVSTEIIKIVFDGETLELKSVEKV